MQAITVAWPPTDLCFWSAVYDLRIIIVFYVTSHISPYLCLSECPSQQITCSFTVVINVHFGVVSCLQEALVPPEKNFFAAFPISAGSVGSSAWNPMLVLDATTPLCESVKSSKNKWGYPPTVARAMFPAFVFHCLDFRLQQLGGRNRWPAATVELNAFEHYSLFTIFSFALVRYPACPIST